MKLSFLTKPNPPYETLLCLFQKPDPNQRYISAPKGPTKARGGWQSQAGRGERLCGDSGAAAVPGKQLTCVGPGTLRHTPGSTHTLCASGHEGRASSVCREPGSARLPGAAAGRGRAGLAGEIWPPPGAALLGHRRAALVRRTMVSFTVLGP